MLKLLAFSLEDTAGTRSFGGLGCGSFTRNLAAKRCETIKRDEINPTGLEYIYIYELLRKPRRRLRTGSKKYVKNVGYLS